MNKSVITSISLLGSGVVVGVVACIALLTNVEWQKASKASQMHNTKRQLAASIRTGSDTKKPQAKNATKAKTLQVARTPSKANSQKVADAVSSPVAGSSTSPPESRAPVGPAARTVVPNILHQALQTAPMQGQLVVGNNGMVSGNGMIPGAVQVMPTTYIIPQPDIQIIVPGTAGPMRAVDSADAVPMPIGRNGLQQNPCVDPGSSYGRAYNRGSSY